VGEGDSRIPLLRGHRAREVLLRERGLHLLDLSEDAAEDLLLVRLGRRVNLEELRDLEADAFGLR